MRRFLVGLTAAALLTGCATGEQWSTWYGHQTHFASGEHMGFSLRNGEGKAPKVSRPQIALARTEGWWGQPVTVAQEQVLEQ